MRRPSTLAIAAIGICSVQINICAAAAPDQFDIIGLKLGMTVSQAKTLLEKYDPKIKVTTCYSLESTHFGCSTAAMTTYQQAKNKTPYMLQAALLTHAFNKSGAEIVDQNSEEAIFAVSGEWYNLLFTPTDDGGRLYAIGRTVAYPSAGETFSELNQKFDARYGKPSVTYYQAAKRAWVFDIRGRQLEEGNREFARCVHEQNNGSAVSFILSKPLPGIQYTWKAYAEEYEKSGRVITFSPAFDGPFFNSPYKQCGIQLQIESIEDESRAKPARIRYFVERLTDQNATLFDNGVDSYWKDKVAPAPVSAAPRL